MGLVRSAGGLRRDLQPAESTQVLRVLAAGPSMSAGCPGQCAQHIYQPRGRSSCISPLPLPALTSRLAPLPLPALAPPCSDLSFQQFSAARLMPGQPAADLAARAAAGPRFDAARHRRKLAQAAGAVLDLWDWRAQGKVPAVRDQAS